MSDLPAAPRRPSRPQSLWLAAIFVAGSFAPLVLWVATGEADDTVAMEQRDPAPAPAVALEREALRALPAATDAWFSDRFPLRHELIRAYSAVIWFGLGQSAASGMLRGDDGWLFIRGERTLLMQRGFLFDDGQVATWAERYAAWRDWLAARGVEYVFVLAPEKQSIYPEYLPDWAGPRPARTRTDQVVAALRERGVRVVDTRGPILAAKAEAEAAGRLLYYPHGTHWTDHGAFVAYRELMLALAEVLPGMEPLARERYRAFDPRERAPEWTGDSWLVRMHLGDVVRQEVTDLEPTFPVAWVPTDFWMARSGGMDGVVENAERRLPRAVLLRDSFGEWLWKFMANHFSRMVSESWERFDVGLVEREAPDVVISVRVERLFTQAVTPAALGPEEVAEARRWNAATPLAALDGASVVGPLALPSADGGERGAALLVRLERTVAADRHVVAPVARREGTLVGADGGRQTLSIEFGAGRRWAFAGPVDVALPARLELAADGPSLVSLAVRAGP